MYTFLEEICKHNDIGKCIYEKDTYNHEFWYERDSKGREIYIKSIDGHELWTEYDDFDRIIHKKDGSGNEDFFDYNEYGELIHEINTEEDIEAFYVYQHDSSGRISKCTEFHTLNDD